MVTIAEGHELAGRYVVGHQLGVGGSGQVWKARDTVLERPVAVKVVPDGAAAARLAREARATAGIGVPNVVGVYDVGEQDGVHFLVMEYVDGVDLSTLLHVTGPLEPDVAALVGRDVARGVAAVHAADLVHRDVTPANVLVTVEGEVKLTDLGIARRTDAGATRQLTQPGTVVGTVDYLAPEQVQGGDVTSASDVYSVGLLLHTVCTGRAPFGDGPMSERVARRLAGGPDLLGEEIGQLADVIGRAVQVEPADRPADGDALRDLLAPLVPTDEQPLRTRLAERVGRAAEAGPAGRAYVTDAVEGMAVQARQAPAVDRGLPPGAADAENPSRTGDDAPAEQQASDAALVGDATTVMPAAAGSADRSPESDADTGPQVAVTAAGGSAVTASSAGTPERAATPSTAPAPAEPDSNTSMLRPIIASVLGVVVVVGLVSAIMAGGGGDGSEGGDGGGGGQEVQPLAIAGVDDHDPLGGGGEHGDEIGRIADGDPETAWDTEGYNSPDLGGLKSGVGFLVDLGEVTEVAAVEVDLGLDGVAFAVTVSEGRPSGDPTQEATVLGTASDAAGTARVEGEEPVAGQWVAVWFTSLGDDGGRFRAEVAEVRVLGP